MFLFLGGKDTPIIVLIDETADDKNNNQKVEVLIRRAIWETKKNLKKHGIFYRFHCLKIFRPTSYCTLLLIKIFISIHWRIRVAVFARIYLFCVYSWFWMIWAQNEKKHVPCWHSLSPIKSIIEKNIVWDNFED